ncbi:hypothetical protein Pcac1_g15790 [Phytophthora cactorum]|uniref:RxLR effector protein n=2 Tax=Phytophthora cactorum TaxID=29920 RepID=A0A8T1AM14_9STRA|nr:hypothetical protein Pcac1_g15790 [Phytophthora cactorum]KAG2813539.1 hypothetical protein PC113_g23426 [Phytophthora cactorum]KAG2877160.1 hypothetical protein PC115_g23427 [Phytophthora cactorum]KAG2882681.1 hypothetical protein PC117_g26180 [Phytophthora cactorum]KAG2974445.1 hypothetical protein PC120_g25989 [Phytophthora cactorum]
MSLRFIFFAAVVTLLARCDAASTATEAKVSTVTSSDTVLSIDAPPVKSARFLLSVKTDQDSDVLDSEEEVRGGIQLTPIDDDLLNMLKIDKAVALKTLSKHDDNLMQKLRENPSWARKVHGWKEDEPSPLDVLKLLKKYPQLSREHSTEWNAWRVYLAQQLRLEQGLTKIR